MKKTLDTKIFETDNESYIVDLVIDDRGVKHIEITQVNFDSFKEKQKIKIPMSETGNLIDILIQYQGGSAKQKISDNSHAIKSGAEIEQIISRYLKGLAIKDLALQFDMSITTIVKILRDNGIAIVSQELPKSYTWKKKK